MQRLAGSCWTPNRKAESKGGDWRPRRPRQSQVVIWQVSGPASCILPQTQVVDGRCLQFWKKRRSSAFQPAVLVDATEPGCVGFHVQLRGQLRPSPQKGCRERRFQSPNSVTTLIRGSCGRGSGWGSCGRGAHRRVRRIRYDGRCNSCLSISSKCTSPAQARVKLLVASSSQLRSRRGAGRMFTF